MSEEIINPDKQSVTETKRCGWARIRILISTIALVIIIIAFAYGYYALTKVNNKLSDLVVSQQNEITHSASAINMLQTKVEDLQKFADRTKEIDKEQQQLIAQFHSAQQSDFEKWHAAEAQYLVKLANDNIQYMHDATAAYMLLKRAEEILQTQQDPNLLEVRKSLATDLAGLQILPEQDITQLFLRLNSINSQLDKLPLRFNPLQTQAKAPEPEATEQLPWWKAGLKHSWQALKQIVVVRNTDNAMPLVFPDEKMFLYQNLHAQMQSAIWGLLHRNGQVYQTSLSWAMDWVQQYFDQDAQATKNVLADLQSLQKIDIQAPSLNLANTLQLFNVYFAQVGQEKKQ